jgi:hypothetical protein
VRLVAVAPIAGEGPAPEAVFFARFISSATFVNALQHAVSVCSTSP